MVSAVRITRDRVFEVVCETADFGHSVACVVLYVSALIACERGATAEESPTIDLARAVVVVPGITAAPAPSIWECIARGRTESRIPGSG